MTRAPKGIIFKQICVIYDEFFKKSGQELF